MRKVRFSRRELLTAAAAGALVSHAGELTRPARAQARATAAEPITPALVEAATKEGKLAFYTAMDLAHCITWKRNGWLAPYMPEEVTKHFEPKYYDPDGLHITTRILISPLAYNTNLVKKEEAPKSFKDLLDPKWAGKLVKAHPAYSGTIMNATFQTARELGWEYFEKLAKQRVLQVQSATDTPKKITLGERAIMIDGAGYLVIRDKEDGQPVEIVYPEEGTPLAASPSAVFKAAPNPNAARLFQNWMHGREAQQLLVDVARQYSPHAQTVEKPGVRRLADIKLMKEDPEGVEKTADEVKTRYGKIFGV